MLGIGFGEFILIAGIALVVMGPEKFPEVAKIAIRFLGEFRTHWDDIKREVTKEIKPLNKELKQLSQYDPEEYLRSLTPKEEPRKSASAQNAPLTEASPDLEPGADPLEHKDEAWDDYDSEHHEPYPYSGHIVEANQKSNDEGTDTTTPPSREEPVSHDTDVDTFADFGGENQDSVTETAKEDPFDVPEVRRLD